MSPHHSLPAHLSVRRPTHDDLPAIFALIQTGDIDAFGHPSYAMQELQRLWSRPTFNPVSDAWVIVEPNDTIIGYAYTGSRNHIRVYCEGVVHPDYSHQGIGSMLVWLMEERAREHIPLAPPGVRVYMHMQVRGGHEPSARLLTDRGYTCVRRISRMQLVMDEPPPAPVWPEDITLRTMVPGQDEYAIWEAMQEAFSDHWGHAPETFEHWVRRYREPRNPPPDLQFLAMAGETVAGAALCVYLDGSGWVDDLGVRRAWRRRGLGLALLHHAFGEFYRRGIREIGLTADAQSLTGAIRLYQRAGMHPLLHYDTYEKELRPGVELAVQSLADA